MGQRKYKATQVQVREAHSIIARSEPDDVFGLAVSSLVETVRVGKLDEAMAFMADEYPGEMEALHQHFGH